MGIGIIVAILILAAFTALGIWQIDKGQTPVPMWILGVFLAFSAGAAGFYFGPQYSVWQQGMLGKAQLAKAEQNRQIRIQEAKAKLESAKLTALAEIERAKGVSSANKIIADSLGGSEGYLRWRYIEMLEETGRGQGDRSIIYIPTEAGLPILEAQRKPPKQ